jgi:alpha-tubulin suppressor-like RCC1 family protein
MLAKECNIAFQQDEKTVQRVEGENHSLLFTNYNRLFVKGKNSFGQLGLGHFEDQKDFVPCFITLNHDEQIKQMALGPHHSLLLTDKNRVLGSGFNYLDQLNFGDRTVKIKFVDCPITLEENETITEMEADFSCSQFKTNQNRVITFGTNTSRYTPNLFSPIQQPIKEESEWIPMLFGL